MNNCTDKQWAFIQKISLVLKIPIKERPNFESASEWISEHINEYNNYKFNNYMTKEIKQLKKDIFFGD